MTTPPALRGRIVAAASELTTEEGWAAVTMARLAERVGVSRQTVYNEVGSKPALAEAMILAELERFLSVVGAAFDAHPDDMVAAIRAAVRSVLELAEGNPLLHAVVSATHGADTELLPLLTTHADSLLGVGEARHRRAPGAVRRAGWRRGSSTPPSTWSCAWCSATSCSPRPPRPPPPTTSPGWPVASSGADPSADLSAASSPPLRSLAKGVTQPTPIFT